MGTKFRSHIQGTLRRNIRRCYNNSFFQLNHLGAMGTAGLYLLKMMNLRKSSIQSGCMAKGEKNMTIFELSEFTIRSIQVAILLEKMKIFPTELKLERKKLNRLFLATESFCQVPEVSAECTSAWAQYTVKVPNRPHVQAELQSLGIPSVIYYPIPLTMQHGYREFP